MKKRYVVGMVILLITTILVGCSTLEDPVPSSSVETEESVDASSVDPHAVYADQTGRYYVALSEKWGEEAYIDNAMSELPSGFYEGDPLENVGFGFLDLDNDGSDELIIGAIRDAETDPVVFEIWTLVDGQPVMIAQSSARNRYFLQYVKEDNVWYVANEGSNSAFNHGTYYLMLMDGRLEVIQGILYDAEAEAENPWFMTYDRDWDVSNDEPIDEDMANAILESNRKHYTVLEYAPYSLYQ